MKKTLLSISFIPFTSENRYFQVGRVAPRAPLGSGNDGARGATRPTKFAQFYQTLCAIGIISLITAAACAQGLVVFATGPAAANRISTNSIVGGPATGPTGNTPGTYCYALYASAVNTSINGNTNAVFGMSPNYVFDNSAGWTLVGMGQNPAVIGRIVATSQGTSSANQVPLNPDGSLTVVGVGGGQYAYFVVVGWSVAGVGTNVDAVKAAYDSGYLPGWIGQSAVSGAIQLGDGGLIYTPDVFSSLGPPYLRGFVLGLDGMLDGPVIYTQPTNMNVCVGSNATLYVGAIGPGTLSYTWYKDSQPISSGSNPSYQIINATPNDAGQYYAVVASSFYPPGAVTSATATVKVGVPPAISQQPVSQTVAAGTSVSLTVAASGTAPLSYQWYDSGGAIFGATSNSLTFNPAQTYNWDNYLVVVSNVFGTATSLPATLIVYAPVAILTQPVSQLVAFHGTATFAVTASGVPRPAYQWSLNGTNLVGATNSSLTISPVQVQNLGDYSVLLDNGFSTTNSFSAGLYMLPIIVRPFTGAVGIWGQPTTLEVGAIGSGPISYQWFFNGSAIAQATNANYILPALQFTNAGLYSVVVSSAYGSATNATYQLVVNPAEVSIAMRPSLTINGATGYHYVIQGTFGLADTNTWITLTNLTLSQQIEIWHDDGTNPTDPVNATRFYRVLPGQ